jgi:hypothetical protein
MTGYGLDDKSSVPRMEHSSSLHNVQTVLGPASFHLHRPMTRQKRYNILHIQSDLYGEDKRKLQLFVLRIYVYCTILKLLDIILNLHVSNLLLLNEPLMMVL